MQPPVSCKKESRIQTREINAQNKNAMLQLQVNTNRLIQSKDSIVTLYFQQLKLQKTLDNKTKSQEEEKLSR